MIMIRNHHTVGRSDAPVPTRSSRDRSASPDPASMAHTSRDDHTGLHPRDFQLMAAAVIASLPTAARRALHDSYRGDPHGTLDAVKAGLVANGWPGLAIDRVLPYIASHLDGVCGPLGRPPSL